MEAGAFAVIDPQQRYPVPVPGPPRPLRTPRVAEAELRNGLRVLIVRKPTVPRVEMRLLVPRGGHRNVAVERVVAKTLTAGTSSRSSSEIAEELQCLGASFSAASTADHLMVSGSTLSPTVGAYLGLVSELLTDSRFPTDEVTLERERVVQEVQIARSQPQTLAAEALARRVFGKHPYGRGLPEPGAVRRVGRAALQRFTTEALTARGAVLILVGDVQPRSALAVAEEAFGSWPRRRPSSAVPPPPPLRPGPTLFVDRPGSVQTNIRIAGPALPPTDPDAYALEVANTIFGGYFVSRLVENIRERKGYTYSPRSEISHRQRASLVEVAAEVGAEVTVASLVEMRYELGRMAALEVSSEELESAQQYRSGVLAVRIQSQAGLATTLAGLVTHGLDVDYLRTYPRRIAAVTTAQVREMSLRFLAPAKLVTVLVGDAGIAREVEALEPVTVSAVAPT
jgi:predicted Zn-dependent peptidase